MKKILSIFVSLLLFLSSSISIFAYPVTTEVNELPGVYNEATFDPANPEASRVGDKPIVKIEKFDKKEGTYRKNHDVGWKFETLPTEIAASSRQKSSTDSSIISPLYAYTYDNTTKSRTNSTYSGIVAYTYTTNFTSGHAGDSTCMYIGFDNASGVSKLETGISQVTGDTYYHPFCNTVDVNGNVTSDHSQDSRTYSKNTNVKLKAEITSYSNGYATAQIYINDVLVYQNKQFYLGASTGRAKICNGVYDGAGSSNLPEMNFNTVKLCSSGSWAQYTVDWPQVSYPDPSSPYYHFHVRFSADHYIKYVAYNYNP